MNQDLLQKLKDAGFPQKTTIKACANGICTDVGLPYEPTTDELLDEIGDAFVSLTKGMFPNQWVCLGNGAQVAGYTRKEALINLYLALNQE